MGKPQKKRTGAEKKAIAKAQTTQYISRTRAMRKLQLTLPQFRRLCVLKGIHPVEPATKKLSKHRTFYHQMDIRFIGHDPLINTIREQHIFKKKAARAGARNADGTLRRMMANKPIVNIDHVVRERYPTFMDALSDLEDPLCMIFVCARMRSNAFLQPNVISECLRLSSEFLTYVTQSNSLRKVFVTIKGIYYQAEIMGITVNWLVPLEYALKEDDRVDDRLISNFVEFYIRMLSFVNYKLYASLGFEYPPRAKKVAHERGDELAFTLRKIKKPQEGKLEEEEKSAKVREVLEAQQLQSTQKPTDADKKRISSLETKLNKMSKIVEEEPEQSVEGEEGGQGIDSAEVPTEVEAPAEDSDISSTEVKSYNLFKDHVFFVNREVPLVHLSFMIKSFQGRVSFSGGNIEESDSRITHQIVDKEFPSTSRVPSREYVQPQWVFDSINAGILLPVHEYAPEAILPPHLSPFVTPEEEGYVPDQRKHLDELIKRENKQLGENDEEQDSEGTSDQDDEDAEDYEGDDVEARHYDELMQESRGLTYSEVSREQEEKKRAAQAAKDAQEAEDLRVHEIAGLPYVQPKNKKLTRKDIKAEEKKELNMSIMSRAKRTQLIAIERNQKRKQERVQKLEDKSQAIKERKLQDARQKIQEQEHDTTNKIVAKKRSKQSDKPQAKKHKV